MSVIMMSPSTGPGTKSQGSSAKGLYRCCQSQQISCFSSRAFTGETNGEKCAPPPPSTSTSHLLPPTTRFQWEQGNSLAETNSNQWPGEWIAVENTRDHGASHADSRDIPHPPQQPPPRPSSAMCTSKPNFCLRQDAMMPTTKHHNNLQHTTTIVSYKTEKTIGMTEIITILRT